MVHTSLLALTFFTTTTFSGLMTQTHHDTPTLPITLHQIETTAEADFEPVPVKTPPPAYTLPESTFVSQTYNNCGPAAMSMVFSSYGLEVSQSELASKLRPYNSPFGGEDDKSVSPDEFVAGAKAYGFASIYRPNGNEALLKQLVANDIPVVVRTWLNPHEDIGHFRIIRGYDDERNVFIQDDSYQGRNLEYSYDEVRDMWAPFNYSYILVYPKDQEAVVRTIIGENFDEQTAYRNALKHAEQEINANDENPYPRLNLATSYYHLGEYKKAVESYDRAKDALPNRILWYVIEPLYAYQKVKNYDRVFQITDGIISSGNPAYSELYQLRGEIYLERGEKDIARTEFEKAAYYNSQYEPAQKALQSL